MLNQSRRRDSQDSISSDRSLASVQRALAGARRGHLISSALSDALAADDDVPPTSKPIKRRSVVVKGPSDATLLPPPVQREPPNIEALCARISRLEAENAQLKQMLAGNASAKRLAFLQAQNAQLQTRVESQSSVLARRTNLFQSVNLGLDSILALATKVTAATTSLEKGSSSDPIARSSRGSGSGTGKKAPSPLTLIQEAIRVLQRQLHENWLDRPLAHSTLDGTPPFSSRSSVVSDPTSSIDALVQQQQIPGSTIWWDALTSLGSSLAPFHAHLTSLCAQWSAARALVSVLVANPALQRLTKTMRDLESEANRIADVVAVVAANQPLRRRMASSSRRRGPAQLTDADAWIENVLAGSNVSDKFRDRLCSGAQQVWQEWSKRIEYAESKAAALLQELDTVDSNHQAQVEKLESAATELSRVRKQLSTSAAVYLARPVRTLMDELTTLKANYTNEGALELVKSTEHTLKRMHDAIEALGVARPEVLAEVVESLLPLQPNPSQ
ncbi:hypothetical protein BC828DRAFT_392820 [Blastocladiella britannica]|nr:hypothetical protein BC828DRAFT_392820 [Blastocladiella britannica]